MTQESSKECYNYTINLLAQRDYSSHKLTTKLNQKKFDETTINETIEILTERGYIDDDKYFKMRSKGWILKGHSDNQIKYKAKIENLPFNQETCSQLRLEYDMSVQSQIEELIRKKTRSISLEILQDEVKLSKKKNSIFRYVVSKGHCDFDLINKCLNKELAYQYKHLSFD